MRSEPSLPEAKDMAIPVWVPSPSGNSKLTVGKGSLKGGQLVVKFSDKLPAIAIQRMLERGALIGMNFVMLQPDPKNEAMQVQISEEENANSTGEASDEKESEVPGSSETSGGAG